MNITKTKKQDKLSNINICPDYDKDCKDVIDTTECFLGFPDYDDIGIADGFCQESINRSIKYGNN